MDPKRIHFVGTLSTEPSTLRSAIELLQTAKDNEPLGKTIASCSLIIATASLAKMVGDRISYAAYVMREVEGEPEKAARLLAIMDRGLVHQVKQFPFVYSEGEFYIDETNMHFHRLRRMINHRNKLVHIPDGKVILSGADPCVSIENGIMKVMLPIPADPWLQISPRVAKEMLDSAWIYYNEVLRALPEHDGLIVRKCTSRKKRNG